MQASQHSKAIATGALAGVFFSSTYILNSFLASTGGHWAWTTGLRTTLLVLLLGLLLQMQGQLKQLLQVMGTTIWVWIGWGSVAFGLTYFFLTYGAMFGPGWLVAGVFQFTIVAGILIAPFIYKDGRARIPVRALLLSVLILMGIVLMQWSQREGSYTTGQLLTCVGLVLTAAFLWPLANRKLMLHLEVTQQKLSAMQRVAGTAIGSLPFNLLLMGYGYSEAGWPSEQQVLAVSVIAVSSGVLGCIFFFKAMHMVRTDGAAMAAVEATQSLEILVTVIGEVLLLGIAWPGWSGNFGMMLIMGGLLLYSVPARRKVLALE
ncbi:multidrug resistance efflux transporter family protein [Pontibacter beigongshangensis]|uniref:multidrug resistance efflux transporter family protein n=1 Tax=Pontibacter beigongshangensis TaxID=2574733 RepID=UPI0016502C11|nr:multidrug resistance efflux transporter family protein [Pontibacter beigongshangensis]